MGGQRGRRRALMCEAARWVAVGGDGGRWWEMGGDGEAIGGDGG